MDKLTELSQLCKGEVSVFINEHINYYISVDKYLDDNELRDDIDCAVAEEMVRRDTIVCVHFYPDTPVGYFSVYHYDVESALNMALEIVYRERYDDEVVDRLMRNIYEEKNTNKKHSKEESNRCVMPEIIGNEKMEFTVASGWPIKHSVEEEMAEQPMTKDYGDKFELEIRENNSVDTRKKQLLL